MGTKKGQVRRTARRAYESVKKNNNGEKKTANRFLKKDEKKLKLLTRLESSMKEAWKKYDREKSKIFHTKAPKKL